MSLKSSTWLSKIVAPQLPGYFSTVPAPTVLVTDDRQLDLVHGCAHTDVMPLDGGLDYPADMPAVVPADVIPEFAPDNPADTELDVQPDSPIDVEIDLYVDGEADGSS